LLFVALTVWVIGATAASAGTLDAARHHRRVSAITFTSSAHGTLIRITYVGRTRPFVRIIESRDAIDALAVTDVDNDGDLDIVASARDAGLVMWRNGGKGHFRLATVPQRRIVNRPGAKLGRCLHADAPIQAGDDRYDAAMPRAPTAAADDPVLAQFAARFISIPVPVRQRPSGRAPPTHA
jgi:hypothetical protein